MSDLKDQQMEVKIKDKVLTITIGTDLLIYALNAAPCAPYKITNKRKFLTNFKNYLLFEGEDGGNTLHRAFDEVVQDIFENGEEGIEDVYDDED